MVNRDRLWDRLMEVAQIGQDETGGVTRLPFTEEERKAKDLAAGYMKEAGLRVYEDAAGNLCGRKEGRNPQAPAVLTGSHLDTQFNGGNFDGVLGVLGAIEALQTMYEQGIVTEHPIEVIAFTNEETTRFPNGCFGSRCFVGKVREPDLQLKDKHGITIAEAMKQAGYRPEDVPRMGQPQGAVKAFVELHIEQGKILEDRGLSVGVVEGIYAQLTDRFTLIGEADHAGTTPMYIRKDALGAASEIVLEVEKEARQAGIVATIGQLDVYPGGINIIPGKAVFSLNVRALEVGRRDDITERIYQKARQIGDNRGVSLSMESLGRTDGAACESSIREAIEAACGKTGLEVYPMPSGAGHDAMVIAEICPIGMIFVRSRNGLSHNPDEYSSPEDCRDGTNVLYHTLIQLAESD